MSENKIDVVMNFILSIVSIVLIGFIGYCIGYCSLARDIRQFAIDNEMAYYNSTNGSFTWHTNVIGGAELFQ